VVQEQQAVAVVLVDILIAQFMWMRAQRLSRLEQVAPPPLMALTVSSVNLRF
jgi:hypothetical protein